MGKRKRNKGKGGNPRPEPAWKDIVKKNELMESFYKSQHIVPDDEWNTFMQYCRKDLPSTFRITKIRGHAKDLLRSLKEGYISKITPEDCKSQDSAEADDAADEGAEQGLFLEPIKWYPDELAWSSNLSRRFIRRSDVLQRLHRFLVEDSECGAITRQEAVSMIPPMLLDVKPHHLVLDMCAAPGSKTAQLIEMMHVNDKDEIPTGAVLANDADHKRCYMLTHQAKRLNTPCVIITNHDASIYPKLYAHNKSTGSNELLYFDRVLCDVPCSGDGTLRKNPLMWHKWTPHLGVSLHRLQMRILIRGLELLKVGGRLVYSTCSFNPIENEAVIAAILSKVNGSVELVDCSNELPELKRMPGLKNWKVFDRKGKEFSNFEEVNCSPTEGFKECMFPPSEEEAKILCLDRCMRVYPHLQNTGGFFIAVLEKKNELPWQKVKRSRNNKLLPWETDKNEKAEVVTEIQDTEKAEAAIEISSISNDTNDAAAADKLKDDGKESPAPKKFRRGMIREDPYFFLDDTDEDMQDVRKFYDLSYDLPSHHFLVRSTGFKKRHVYLVSEAVHNVIKNNDNLKVVNTGVRIVTRSPFKAGTDSHGVKYRLVQDGIHLIQRFINKRIIKINDIDLIALLSSGDTDMEKLSAETQAEIGNIEMGCIIWHYKARPDSVNLKFPITSDIWMCGQIGRKVVQSMLAKEERKHFLRLVGAEIPEGLSSKTKGPNWGDSKKEENKADLQEGDDNDDQENAEVEDE